MNPSNFTGVEKKTRVFLESLRQASGPPLYKLSPEQARAVLSGLQASIPVKKLPADIESRTILGGPNGTKVSIQIVRPPNNNKTFPTIMYFHGGGWVLGGFDTHER